MNKGPWFTWREHWVQWLESSPANRSSRCDNCSRVVQRTEARLRVDNDKGPIRKRGKGKRHTYLCTTCAKDVPHLTADQLSFTDE